MSQSPGLGGPSGGLHSALAWTESSHPATYKGLRGQGLSDFLSLGLEQQHCRLLGDPHSTSVLPLDLYLKPHFSEPL